MFLHNFKYTLKLLFKDKTMMFWTIGFGIILATLFNLTLSTLYDSTQFRTIDIAFVINDEEEKKIKENKDGSIIPTDGRSSYEINTYGMYKEIFTNFNEQEESDDKLFNVSFKNKEETVELLDNSEITGYLEMVENKPVINVKKNGIEETIFKFVLEEIENTNKIISKSVESRINAYLSSGKHEEIGSGIERLIEDTSKKVEDFKLNIEGSAKENTNFSMLYIYTAIAMVTLYGALLGAKVMSYSMANISKEGKRISISPTKKFVQILSAMLASYVVQILALALLFVYTIFALKTEYGNDIWRIVLLSLVGSYTGLAIGVFVGGVFKVSENIKVGIIVGFTMLFSFLSGMMDSGMKYLIDTSAPLVNKMNPAALITDGLYSLYYYSEYTRYNQSLIILSIMGTFILFVSALFLRRQKYDSI